MNTPATMHPRQPNWLGCVRFVVGFCGALIVFNPGNSADVAEESPGWELLAQYRFKEALLAFEQNSATGVDSKRSIALGEALSRLVSPSYNEADLPAIVSELEQIWQSNSRDKAGLWAGYYLGRIRQNHANAKADYDAALTWYERVATAGGDDLMAQTARLKAVGLLLFAPLDAVLTSEERFQQAQDLVANISEPYLQMNALLVLGNGMFYRDAAPDRVLPSLESAWRLGVTDPTARAQILIQIGNLATKVGKPHLAADCYQQFLDEFPREKRNQMVREQLALLPTLPADE